MSAYQIHTNEKDMVSAPSSEVNSFGSSLISQQGSLSSVRPVASSRGRSLTPNPMPNGGGPVDTNTLLQSLFASTTLPSQPSPNSRQQAPPSLGHSSGMFGNPPHQPGVSALSSGGASGLYNAGNRAGVGSSALSAIFPSSTAPSSAKDIPASANHLIGSSSSSKLLKSDLMFGGPGGNPGGPLGLSESDFPSLSVNFGAGGGSSFGNASSAGSGNMPPSLASGAAAAAAAAGTFSIPPPSSVGGYGAPPLPQGAHNGLSGVSGMGTSGGPPNIGAGSSSGPGFGAGSGFPSGSGNLYGQPPPVPTTSHFGAVAAPRQGMYGAPGSGLHSSDSMTSNNFGLMKSADSQSEFQINNEDFPALPLQGTPNDTRPGNLMLQPSIDGSKDGSRTSDEKLISSPKEQSGIITNRDGTVSNIPPGMIRDQFGMVGMLTFLRALESHPNIVSLALGTELTHLGLNLNAPARNLYQTFAGPWMDIPCRPQDLDCHVPQEYITNHTIRDRLSPIKLNRYSDDLLFFLFYMCTCETFQLGAAIELYKRDWRYCKEERFWITRPQGMPPQEKTDTHERGMYYIFDPTQWRKFPREMVLEYAKLERLDIPQGQQQSMFQTYPTGPPPS